MRLKALRILLVNNKGCFDPGIITLAKVLSRHHRVVVVGPLRDQGGKGHRLTTNSHPLRAKQYFVLNKVKIFGVNGTPCDCVLLALDKLLKSKPDLIITGIDPKHNRGELIYHSSVVSAAIEGTIQGIKSIALSAEVLDPKSERAFLPVARAFARKLPYFFNNIPKDHTINVNFPQKFNLRRIKATHLTNSIVNNHYIEEVNPFGATFYWLHCPIGEGGYPLHVLDQQGDIYWLKKGFITVTPLKLDLTDDELYEQLSETLNEG